MPDAALAQFLSFLWVPDPRTPYAGIQSLEPGTVLRWTPGSTQVSRYCEPLHPATGQSPLEAVGIVAELRWRFCDAVRRQLRSDVPVALKASGGVDSSLIWWAAGSTIERAYTKKWRSSTGRERLAEDTAAVEVLSRKVVAPVTYGAGERAAQAAQPFGAELIADPAYYSSRRSLCFLVLGCLPLVVAGLRSLLVAAAPVRPAELVRRVAGRADSQGRDEMGDLVAGKGDQPG